MKYLLIIAMFSLVSCGYEYSNGNRVGSLYKLSKKGFFCKSWEGTLKTGFVASNENGMVTAEQFNFSVASEEVAQKLLTLEGKKVSLEYVQVLFRTPCSYDTSYIVRNVEEVKN